MLNKDFKLKGNAVKFRHWMATMKDKLRKWTPAGKIKNRKKSLNELQPICRSEKVVEGKKPPSP